MANPAGATREGVSNQSETETVIVPHDAADEETGLEADDQPLAPAPAGEAPAGEGAAPAERRLSRREEQMQAIHEARRQALVEEGVQLETAQPDAEGDPAAAAAEPEPAAPAQANAAAQPERMVQVKINGVVETWPESRVLAAAQKNESADRRLEQAAHLEREVRRRAAEVAQREAQMAQARAVEPNPASPGAPVPAPATQPNQSVPELTPAELARQVRYGTEEEAAEAFQKLIQAGRGNATPDPEALAATVQQRIEAKTEFQTSLAEFGREYRDVVEDEGQAYYAAQMVQQIRQKDAEHGVQRTPLETFKLAGDAARKWRERLVSRYAPQPAANNPKPAPAAATVQNRDARKAAMPQTPQAATARFAPARSAPPKSASDVVAEMNRSRGKG